MEVHDTVQGAGIKTIPKKKKCKKAKWLSEEVLQITEKWKEVKDKREKKRKVHLNAKFQRIASKEKKVKLLSRVRLFATPWTVVYQLLCPWDFPGKNTGLGCHFLLRGIFLTQESSPGLLHCRQTLPSEPPGKPLRSHPVT